MKRSRIIVSSALVLALVVCIGISSVYACTGIRLISTDKGVVYGRTMEWGAFDFHSRAAVIPRGYSFTGTTPEGMNGKKWEAKYGFVGIDMLKRDIYADGMNEKGLAIGLFYHPGFSSYPDYDKGKASNSITTLDVASYVLSQFATVDEVRDGMSKVRVVGVVDKAIGIQVDGHFLVTDREGKSIVIEFTDGKVKFFDDPLGIITNAPNFDWHITNLRNYLSLSPTPLPSKKIGDLEFKPIGAGSGMLGLPGDFTPPSRFVRAFAWTQTVRSTQTSSETVYEAFRILDNFNLPLGPGAAEGSGKSLTKGMRSSTIWTVVWDLSERVLYYHTQHNRRVRAFDLNKIDFTKLDSDRILRRPLDLDSEKRQDIEYIEVKN